MFDCVSSALDGRHFYSKALKTPFITSCVFIEDSNKPYEICLAAPAETTV